jgi:hypothetical protein
MSVTGSKFLDRFSEPSETEEGYPLVYISCRKFNTAFKDDVCQMSGI